MPSNRGQGWKRKAGKPMKWPQLVDRQRQELKRQSRELLESMTPTEQERFLRWLGQLSHKRKYMDMVPNTTPISSTRPSPRKLKTITNRQRMVINAGRGMLRKVLRKSLPLSEAVKKKQK